MEGTMELWHVDVSDRIDSRGVYILFIEGKSVMIEGDEFVRDKWDCITRRNEKWFSSKEEASVAAAERVEELANILLKQAAELREAAHAPA